VARGAHDGGGPREREAAGRAHRQPRAVRRGEEELREVHAELPEGAGARPDGQVEAAGGAGEGEALVGGGREVRLRGVRVPRAPLPRPRRGGEGGLPRDRHAGGSREARERGRREGQQSVGEAGETRCKAARSEAEEAEEGPALADAEPAGAAAPRPVGGVQGGQGRDRGLPGGGLQHRRALGRRRARARWSAACWPSSPAGAGPRTS